MATQPIQRPERWTIPFSEEMSDEVVAELLDHPPFCDLDPEGFRGKVTPHGILQNDARVGMYLKGEVVVRQGDWGNSAFFVLDGSLRAELESQNQPDEDAILEKHRSPKKNFFQLFAQLWNNPSGPEVRNVASYQTDYGKRGSGKQTRIFLPDLAMVLDDRRTVSLGEGQFFGELSALGRTPRQATVVAETTSQLLEIRWQGLRDLMRGDKGIRNHIDTVFRERALKWFLLNTPIFQHLTQTQLALLVAAAEFETHGKYDWSASFKRLVEQSGENDQNLEIEPLIAKEGDHPNGVIIVRSGLARLTKHYENGQRTVGYLSPGQVYGMDEIVQGWQSDKPRALKYSLRAIGITTVVVIPTKTVEQLLIAQESKPTSKPVDKQRTLEASVDQFERLNTDFVELMVKKRFANGTATMLIDMDRCTRCDDCVRACASTHENNPRFLRDGPIQNNVMIAGACMHCEDPVCMIECPTGAIHRNIAEGQVVINDQTCIGCSACANNCPYDAIRMVEIRHKDGEMIRDTETQTPIVKATKCDLCFDQLGGPACQRACPHNAMVRLDMHDTDSVANWFDR